MGRNSNARRMETTDVVIRKLERSGLRRGSNSTSRLKYLFDGWLTFIKFLVAFCLLVKTESGSVTNGSVIEHLFSY